MDSDCSSEGSWNQWNEEVNEFPCIFTGTLYKSVEEYFNSLNTNSNFNIWNLVNVELKLDNFFGYVKLINYLRAKFSGKQPPTFDELNASKSLWLEGEVYLKPVLADDPLLMFNIFNSGEESDNEFFEEVTQNDAGESFNQGQGNLAKVNTKLTTELTQLKDQMKQMQLVMQDILINKSNDISRSVSACRKAELDDEDYEDSGYFQSYDHFDIHREMLQDQIRTLAYKDAVEKNPSVFKDKVVLDVGCGSGILSMIAAKAGAKKVYAVEKSEIVTSAIANIFENGLQDKIQVLHTNVEEINLPEKVDIIISEWMGYFLLYESMLDSVLQAAGKWLNPGGFLLPNQAKIYLCASNCSQIYNRYIDYWQDVYGFKMSCMKTSVVKEATVLDVPADSIVTNSAKVFDLEITKDSSQKQLDFKQKFSLTSNADDKIRFIVGYFDVDFNLPETSINLPTCPVKKGERSTHWKQTVFFLPQPLDVKSGEVVEGEIYCRKNPNDPRSLLVDMEFGGSKLQYHIS